MVIVPKNGIAIRPLIFWEGFPPCGLLIKKIADHYCGDMKVLGTKAAVPFEELTKMLGHDVDWLSDPNDIWDRRDEFADRNLIIHTGWSHPGWLKYDRWMKKKGAKVVVAVDNCWKANLRQAGGAVWFRCWLRRHFDAALVPGRSATRLMRFLGMPKDRIFSGYYGAYEGIYRPGPQLADRRAEFLYVGQLIRRKGVDVLLAAYRRYREMGGKWSLRIIGSGPLADQCNGEGVIFEGFAQARLVATRMSEARCFILPSREDHWGTVVCEAMACGTPVIASRWVGSAEDLILHGINGAIFHEMSAPSLATCMLHISGWPDEMMDTAGKTSIGMAGAYGSSSYASSHQAIVNALFANS